MRIVDSMSDAICDISIIAVVAIVPVLGATVSRKRRIGAVICIAGAGSLFGFAADMYTTEIDGPSLGFIGGPLVFIILFFVGVACRAAFDRARKTWKSK